MQKLAGFRFPWFSRPRNSIVEFTDRCKSRAKAAEEDPVGLPAGLRPATRAYVFLYTLCLNLAVHTAPEPFVLPQPRVVAWTGLRKDAVSAIVRWLRRKGLIECVDEKYAFGGRKSQAKKYKVLQ